ncbi:uncharacterized protein EDB91DRAFT_1057552 [Suillus paluster]|uniref:uncharacterized protein n=1 Tax=Suillus paluster TaxID=48578 RepID=UPI001B86D91E|nr:uncharacterized protein EDB91DRAFT_1057552 [Suillus paluster]KAG1733396.1 hypothetical protein EDB91DRAFT_1057552 [Suillus paluster]
MMTDYGMDVEAIPYTAPSGEEGMELSHASGEHEAFEGLAGQIADLSGHRYIDPRTREDHTESQTNHWHLQIDLLVDAYLDYRFHDSGDSLPTFDDMSAEPLLDDSSGVSLTNIELIDLFSTHSSPQSHPFHRYPNETLIYHGYIGCAPLYPTAAILLRTLATYRQIHRSCP